MAMAILVWTSLATICLLHVALFAMGLSYSLETTKSLIGMQLLIILFSVAFGIFVGFTIRIMKGSLGGILSGATGVIGSGVSLCFSLLAYIAFTAFFSQDLINIKAFAISFLALAGTTFGMIACGGGIGIVASALIGMTSVPALFILAAILSRCVQILSISSGAEMLLQLPKSIAIGVISTAAESRDFYLSAAIGALRSPFYILETARLLRVPLEVRHHPIWWDELSILPFTDTHQVIAWTWRQGQQKALKLLAPLAANPFKRWVLQRALAHNLFNSHEPIHFVYRLFRVDELEAYSIAPVSKGDWGSIPSVRQVFLSELSGRGQDTSIGLEKQVYRLTGFLRNDSDSPLRLLVELLYIISSFQIESNSEPKNDLLAILNQSSDLFQHLVGYPGGEELQSSFSSIRRCLQAKTLADLAYASNMLADYKPTPGTVCPEVLATLQRLSVISKNVAVSIAASSRLNQLAALARATEALEELGPFIEKRVVTPEKLPLLMIRNQWRTLVAEAGGRLGHQVGRKRVVNPYVAGNPVKGNLFVGRDEILGELEELWLKPGQVDSLVLYGHRRMGKSSILQNLPNRLDPAANWVVDLNLQTVNRSHTGSLLFDLATKMHDEVKSRPQVPAPTSVHTTRLSLPEESAFIANYQLTFTQWLNHLAPRMTGRRFIIAIDEYELLEEAMADGRLDPDLTRYLRGVIQSHDWFVLALAGLYTLQEQCEDYWHPLFASVKPRKVSFLSPEATRRLLTQPSDDFPLDYTVDTLDAIHALTNGQPYLVQLIGQNLVAHYNCKVLDDERDPEHPLCLDDLDAVISSPGFFEDGLPYFKGVWAQAKDSPPGQHAILCTLTAGPADLDHLVELTGLARDVVYAALSTLQEHDVIAIEAARDYSFTVELMRRWVAQRPPSYAIRS
jgi:hypothetical protein